MTAKMGPPMTNPTTPAAMPAPRIFRCDLSLSVSSVGTADVGESVVDDENDCSSILTWLMTKDVGEGAGAEAAYGIPSEVIGSVSWSPFSFAMSTGTALGRLDSSSFSVTEIGVYEGLATMLKMCRLMVGG